MTRLGRAVGLRGERELAAWTGLAALCALLEALSMGAVSTFMGLVQAADPDLAGWRALTGIAQRRELLLGLGLAVLLLVTLSKGLNALSVWTQHRLVWAQEKRMAIRLLASFLSRPYSWFLEQNGAHLNRYLGSREFSSNLLAGITDLIAASLVTAAILATLLLVDARVALVTMVGVGLAQATLMRATRAPIRRWSEEAHELLNRRAVVGQEAMTGIKALLSLAREGYYLDEFARLSERGSKLQAWREIMWDVPRFFLEAVALGLMLSLTLYFVLEGGSERLLPMLSLYALAGYRVIPAIHVAFHSITRIRSNLPALAAYLDFVGGNQAHPLLEGSGNQGHPGGRLPMRASLRAEGLELRYPGLAEPVLSQVDFELRPHEVVGIVGSTGAGKSTLVDLLMGLLSPSAGRVCLDGRPLEPGQGRLWRGSVGYVPQLVFLRDDTVRRNIAFAVAEADVDEEAVRRAARAAQIHDFIESLPDGYETRVGDNGVRLSGGQRQRLGIARALYAGPDLLVLDEATSSLDPATEEAVLAAVSCLRAYQAILLVTHRLATVQMCDRIYVLEGGRVCATGTYSELLENSPEFQALLASPRAGHP